MHIQRSLSLARRTVRCSTLIGSLEIRQLRLLNALAVFLDILGMPQDSLANQAYSVEGESFRWISRV